MKTKNKLIVIVLSAIVLLAAAVPVFALVGNFSYGTTHQCADVTCTGKVTAAKAMSKLEMELNDPNCFPQSDYSGRVWVRAKNSYGIILFTINNSGSAGQLTVLANRVLDNGTPSIVMFKYYVNDGLVFENDIY